MCIQRQIKYIRSLPIDMMSKIDLREGMIMARSFSFRNNIFILIAVLSLNCPALAQISLLQGTATKTAVRVPLIKQQATYDYPSAPVTQPAARTRYIHRTGTVIRRQPRSFWARHPMVKSVTIGAGVGAGAGALTGLVTHRGIFRGAAIGAGAGAGFGAIHASQTLRRHPYIRNGAEGAVAGLGLGLAAGRRGGGVAAATGIGGALGLGYRFYRNNMR